MNQSAKRPTAQDPLAFLAGGGEMGERTRALDWSKTPLGPMAGWPQSLKTAVGIMLSSRYAMFIWWGRELVHFYNDAYIPVLGTRHPAALGRPAQAIWSDVWPIVGPQTEIVLNEGRATWNEELLLVMERYQFLEETYFTFSYSPIRDDDGTVGGALCALTDDTQRVLGRRRLRTLRALAEHASHTKTPERACQVVADTLAENPHDLPFVLLYLLAADGREARLVGWTGLGPATPASPLAVDLGGMDTPWPFHQVIETGKAIEVHDLTHTFGALPGGAWPESPQRALVLPMAKPGQVRLAGFVVAGVSPRLALTEEYKGYMNLVASHIAEAVANARAYEGERRRAEALVERDRAKTAFFSNVSHAFRTLLTLMLGPVEELLARRPTNLPPSARRNLDIVHRNGLRLVNTLLDFSRIEAGRVRAVYEPTDLAAFTAELASSFRSACERAELRLVVDCPSLAEPVYVDREMWEKIVLNLLSNAFKFTLAGEIAVMLRQVGQIAELRVRDTGTGIPAEEKPRLFERFHRIENARGRTREGSGIGLALVQELVKLHGGAVAAESVLNQGSTFVVSVPLGSAHLPRDQIGGSRTLASTATGAAPYVEEALRWLPDEGVAWREGGDALPTASELVPVPYLPAEQDEADRPRVLVAHDNADMRQHLVRLLAARYDVEAEADGEAALAAARERPPDLILADVMIPRLDGLALLRALRAEPGTRELPVILLSARAGEESRVEGMEAGADDYLIEPFSARELLARVGGQLQMARLRREADEAVRESEGRLRTFVDNAPAVMGVVELAPDDSDVLHVLDNAATERYFGVPPGGTAGRWGRRDLGVTAETIVEWTQAYREAQRTGRPVRFPYAFDSRPPGEGSPIQRRWLDVSVSHMGPGDEGRDRFCYTAIDDTDRRRAEEALREGEERLRLAKNAAELGIHDYDLMTGTIRWDGRVRALWGVGPDDPITYETFISGLHPDDREAAQARMDQALDPTGDGSYFAEYRVISHTDGVVRWIAATGQASFADGRAVRLVGTVQDISAQKRAEEALRESERHFRTLADTAPALLWVTEPDGACSYRSRGWLEYTGQTEEQARGFGWLGAVHPEDHQASGQLFLKANENHEPFALEYRIRRADGAYRWAMDAGRPRFGADGEFLGYIGSVIDIQDRKRTEEALQEADRRKDEFLATLAHELRNPLAPIRNGLAIMRLIGHDPRTFEQALAMMERQLDHMVRLIDDLLDVSRISRGKIELRRERVALATVVHSAVETTRPVIEAAGHDLRIDIPAEPIYVDADAIRLAQVLANLLNNAAKYTEPGGRIALTVQPEGDQVVVAVEDDGVGIPSAMLSKIFDLFTQDGSPDRVRSGLGIGLHIVKRLTQMHGGIVEARSEGRGKGSVFLVRLPVALPVMAEIRTDGDAVTPDRPTGRRRILVVDDNKDAADSLAMMLNMMGNDSQTAYDGLVALDTAPVFRPDVIVLDIGMPMLNGYETARRIRQQPWGKDVVLVALTGWGQAEDKRRSEEAGFDHHLVKPADLDALGQLLSELP